MMWGYAGPAARGVLWRWPVTVITGAAADVHAATC